MPIVLNGAAGSETQKEQIEQELNALQQGINDIPAFTVLPNQLASTAVDVPGLVVDLNHLLTKLKAGGFMAPDA